MKRPTKRTCRRRPKRPLAACKAVVANMWVSAAVAAGMTREELVEMLVGVGDHASRPPAEVVRIGRLARRFMAGWKALGFDDESILKRWAARNR